MTETNNKKTKLHIKLFLVISIFIYFMFGFNHLTEFITSDEHYWVYDRVPEYWEAISNQKWKKTRINDKPGITLAYVSGIGLLWDKTPRDHMIKDDKTLSAYHSERTEKLNLTFRLPILIFNGFFILVLFWLIKKVTENDWIALLSSVLILLSPILLGISQIVNPDSLLWGFSTASIFAFLAFIKTSTPTHQCEKNNSTGTSDQLRDNNKQHWYGGKKKFAILSSVFLGLALLTKYVATILFPFLFLIILFYFLFTLSDQIGNVERLKKKVLELSIAYFAIIAGSLAVFSILMPAVFIKSRHLWKGTIGYKGLGNIFWIVAGLNLFLIIDNQLFDSKVAIFLLKKLKFLKNILPRIFYVLLIILTLFILVNWISGNSMINLEHIAFDERDGGSFTKLPTYQKLIMEHKPLVFSLTPLVLISILYIWIKSVFKPTRHEFVVFSLSFFFVIFYVAMIKSGLLSTIRYGIILQPLAMILAAIGIYDFLSMPKIHKRIRWRVVIPVVIFISTVSLWLCSPFYFNYTNGLLPKKYLITGAWGYGGYEAAKYLNALPNAENLTVWTDYHGVCEFFKGKCITKHKFNKTDYPIHYYVLTRRGQIRFNFQYKSYSTNSTLNNINDHYNGIVEPEWKLEIGDRPGNFVKVFKVEKK